jgi:hypothetical protein
MAVSSDSHAKVEVHGADRHPIPTRGRRVNVKLLLSHICKESFYSCVS